MQCNACASRGGRLHRDGHSTQYDLGDQVILMARMAGAPPERLTEREPPIPRSGRFPPETGRKLPPPASEGQALKLAPEMTTKKREDFSHVNLPVQRNAPTRCDVRRRRCRVQRYYCNADGQLEAGKSGSDLRRRSRT